MNLRFRTKKHRQSFVLIVGGLFIAIVAFWSIRGDIWTEADYHVLDRFYRHAIQKGYGAPISDRIKYLLITNEDYEHFSTNTVDRAVLARVNDALGKFGAEAIAYDIIFQRPTEAESDQLFAESIKNLGNVYLPVALRYFKQPNIFQWKDTPSQRRLRNDYVRPVKEMGDASCFYAEPDVMQTGSLYMACKGSGHISAYSDPDGIYRHQILLMRIDDRYFPALSLAMFLDYVKIPLESVIVEWGERIVIPADASDRLDEDVVIPIDAHGKAFIPYPQVWGKDFQHMGIHKFIKLAKDINYEGNVTDFCEGSFVFIGDISTGVSDLGQTPLEGDAPLISTHAAMLNGMLTNRFFNRWGMTSVLFMLLIGTGFLGLAGITKSDLLLYFTGAAICCFFIVFAWNRFAGFTLFPVVSATASSLLLFVGSVLGLQLIVSRDRAFIKSAFARYVPPKVVNQLIEQPESLQLGGEEREMTVLFSDLAGFTTISEQMQPSVLGSLLNEYLTEMTNEILSSNGIVDKYLGDAIMAEFGAPIWFSDHADKAVQAALHMQNRLEELRVQWSAKGLPELYCRIGINTDTMIVGNMGSDQVFDYTVIGDAVNLASRLEGANKVYGTSIMISESTFKHLSSEKFRTRLLDCVRVKGKTRSIRVFEVYGFISDPISEEEKAYYRTYQEAIEAYFTKDFTIASKHFADALSYRPKDLAAMGLIDRINSLDPNRLPTDWNGSCVLVNK